MPGTPTFDISKKGFAPIIDTEARKTASRIIGKLNFFVVCKADLNYAFFASFFVRTCTP